MIPTTTTVLDCAATVNEIVAKYPATIAIFNRYGIDSCCGGGVSVEEAAHRDGVDPGMLCRELQQAVASA